MAVPERIKWSYVTHVFPSEALADAERSWEDPKVGDVALMRVLTLGKHSRIDDRNGQAVSLFPGDVVACAFGNRYATDQYEGYVPPAREQYHMLSVGGVCGMVGSKNERMPDPTLLEFVGYAKDIKGRKVNLRKWRLRPVASPEDLKRPAVVLAVGASMNAGKTTTAAMTIRGLSRAGHRVAAAKITGTGAVKDLFYMRDAGAVQVLDFTDYGCPSTYRCSLRKLLRLERTVRSHLLQQRPEYIVYEVADGIFQRETAMLLDSSDFRSVVDHVVFAAVDSLSAESAKRVLEQRGFHLLGFSGIVSASELGKQEVQKATGLPCLSSTELSEGGIVALIEEGPRYRRRRPPVTAAVGAAPTVV
jgi:hypothetical protein